MAERDRKIKHTTRSRVVKLELSNQTDLAVVKVAKTLYNLDHERTLQKATDSNLWHVSDSLYYDAKKSYDGILKPFFEEPQVFKLQATKELLHTSSLDPHAPEDPNLQRINEFLEEEVEPLTEELIGTYLDPFTIPYPWETKFDHGKIMYFNPETFETVDVRPQEVID